MGSEMATHEPGNEQQEKAKKHYFARLFWRDLESFCTPDTKLTAGMEERGVS